MNTKNFFKSLGLTLLVIAIGVLSISYITPSGVEGAAVTVSASVSEAVSCSNSETTTAFGTLSTGSITTASPHATTTLSCNSAAGCTLSVADAGSGGAPGLYKSAAPTGLIPSTDATLSAGTEGYGIQAATSSAGTGAVLTLASSYSVSGNVVGGLTLAAKPLASSTAPTANRAIAVYHKAAIGVLTKAGSYADTITYSCLGN